MIEVGKSAPAFTLDTYDKQVSLSDYKGKWVVLYFYPKDDTPGCTVEANEFTSLQKDFVDSGATVLGMSPDSSTSHCTFRDKYNLNVVLVSDPTKEVMKQYGAWREKNMYGKITVGVIRSTVLIDPEGKIAWHWKRVKAKGHAASVLKRLHTLQS